MAAVVYCAAAVPHGADAHGVAALHGDVVQRAAAAPHGAVAAHRAVCAAASLGAVEGDAGQGIVAARGAVAQGVAAAAAQGAVVAVDVHRIAAADGGIQAAAAAAAAAGTPLASSAVPAQSHRPRCRANRHHIAGGVPAVGDVVVQRAEVVFGAIADFAVDVVD